MECIICQDINQELLQENTSCSCKYNFHLSCWIDYIHSKIKITCPLCRKDLAIKPSLIKQSTIHTPLLQPTVTPTIPPYALQEHNQTPVSPQQISYYQFVDIINQYNSSQNTIIEIPPTQNLSSSHKLIKVIFGLAIIVLIITIIIVCTIIL